MSEQEKPNPYDSNVTEEDRDMLATTVRIAQPPGKRPRKSRSNSAGSAVIDTVAKRKGKGRQMIGTLSEFMNMPLDIFFQVAAHLHPLDILNLARTSKSLRSIVLAKTSRLAWIVSLASVDALPPCPGNMSEPCYAALLFDHHCFLCAANRARWVDYAIRLRLCKTCYKVNIRKGSAIVPKDELDVFRTLPLFPCEIGSDCKRAGWFTLPENRTAANKYYTAYVNATINQYTSLQREDREAAALWVEETLKDVATTHMCADTILVWFRQRSSLKKWANVQIMSDRKSRIIERLQDLGYSEYDFPEGEDSDAWDKLVHQPKPLTDRTWNNIRPKLLEQLAIERERRLQEAFDERVDARLDVLVKWYEEYLYENLTDAELGLMPNRCDARSLPSVFDLALADDARGFVSRRDFRAFTEDMLLEADAYKARAQRDLADVLLSDQTCADLEDVPAADVLQRPCAYFACVRGCNATVDGCPYLTYEQLHAHWREAHPDAPWLQGEEDHEWVEVPELRPLSLPRLTRFVLEAVGIALDTPREVLDGWVREGRLFCSCEHPAMPLPREMSWGKLLFHLLHHIHEYGERRLEMKWLGARRNPNHVLCDGHWLAAGDGCCIKFLPEGADTAAASVRTTVDDAYRAQIEAKFASACPDPGAVAVCRICKGLARKTPQQVRRHLQYMRLPGQAEEIVWHLRYCHGKEFEKRDILFVSI
ncbi:hypothetical protein LXA43DRAFT_1022431 [Ganoderma leucocontextum]|nr:hypothetical protein LXA43DRAFT_1022431 [Ganoderma leucocontextum]